ncbi:MAG TPA: type VI secretion system contractile sheath large subunit [Thermoanaerobaculia bacterium]|nr:type VI secretion system contractile sheath large subunit [Thermoanaerobaculia bacterium]
MEPRETAKPPAAGVSGERSPLDSLLEKVQMSVPEPGEGETAGGRLSQAINLLIHALTTSGEPVEHVDKMVVDKVIADLDERISAQVNEIMHHPQFQQLESAWRGLKFLVSRTDFRRNVKIEVLNVSKQELAADFEDVPEPIQSGLFKHLYVQEYDQPGGEPVGAVIGNYEFDNRPQDIALLRNLSKVSAACHAPFVGAVGPNFFDLQTIDELPRLPDVAPIFDRTEYAAWRSFRDSEDSRYVGLTFPRFLLRLPYGQDTVPAKTFSFTEEAQGEDHGRYLWGNASFAFAATLTRSFAENGWCVNVRGPQSGGLVEDLPLHFYEAAGETTVKIPTEVLISDRREFELSELGFIPLSFYKNKDFACFFSANSVQKPKKYLTDDATANSRLSSRLPYLFLVSRLAHYLKVIQRENIGAAKEKDELQKELEDWIGTLVTEMKDPGAELKARCPLSAASIKVTDIADNPGFYNVEMMVRPHFQIEGVDVALSLVSRLPKAKKA